MTTTAYEFTFKYDCESHEINANTYLFSLLNFTQAIQEINSFLNQDTNQNHKVKINISANAPGSFVVNINLQQLLDGLMAVFSRETITYCGSLVGIFAGIITIRKHLKDEQAKKIEQKQGKKVAIHSSSGILTVDEKVFAMYNEPAIQDRISVALNSIAADEDIKGIAIADDKKEVLSLSSKEIAEISAIALLRNDDNPPKTVIIKNAVLNIIKPSFDASYKWELYHEGMKIAARMEDEHFQSRVDAGESFSSGDSLIANLQIKKEFLKKANTYVNKEYSIVKIVSHQARQQQYPLL